MTSDHDQFSALNFYEWLDKTYPWIQINQTSQGGADPATLVEPEDVGKAGVKQFNDFLANNNMK